MRGGARVKDLRALSVAAVGVLLASGCVGGCSAWSDPDPTLQVGPAVKRVDAMLDETLMSVRPRLKWRDGPASISERRNSFTNAADGEVTVDRARYVRTKLSKRKIAELAKFVEKHWRGEGYGIGDVNRREPSLSGTAPDGCWIKFSVADGGIVRFDADISAISPGYSGEIKGQRGDKFPDGPKGLGPDRSPDLRDPYWSK